MHWGLRFMFTVGVHGSEAQKGVEMGGSKRGYGIWVQFVLAHLMLYDLMTCNSTYKMITDCSFCIAGSSWHFLVLFFYHSLEYAAVRNGSICICLTQIQQDDSANGTLCNVRYASSMFVFKKEMYTCTVYLYCRISSIKQKFRNGSLASESSLPRK